jgi:hypothetical protein
LHQAQGVSGLETAADIQTKIFALLCDYLCKTDDMHEVFQLRNNLPLNITNKNMSIARSCSSVSWKSETAHLSSTPFVKLRFHPASSTPCC